MVKPLLYLNLSIMNSKQEAINFVEETGFPLWKLYKGAQRVAVCDAEDNPDLDPGTGLYEFENALKRISTPGAYSVNVYRNPKGDKGGSRLDFRIDSEVQNHPTTQIPNRSSLMDNQTFIIFIQDQMLIKQALERIETQNKAILSILDIMNDGDKDNDGEIGGIIKTLLLNGVAKAQAVKKAAPVIAEGGFSALK
jgi:hypothetical protein